MSDSATLGGAPSGTKAEELVGTFHRIAGIGPVYQALGITDEVCARIELLETGELAPYRIEDVRLDPHPDETECSPWPST